MLLAVLLITLFIAVDAFPSRTRLAPFVPTISRTKLSDKAAPIVDGEQLEVLLTEWDQPLVVDAYATWCGPCLLMAPEFEAAAKEVQGKVRFVKIDTDKDPEMADRLNVMGLPTLLFLDKIEPVEGQTPEAKAVLKARIEGAIQKDMILALCEHHFFGGPRPDIPV